MFKDNLEGKLKKGPSGLGLMIFLFILIFLIGIAGGGFGEYYLNKKNSPNTNQANAPYSSTSTNNSSKSSSTSTSSEQTYTIQKGDTLFSIGLKFNMPWTTIASANGLTESSVIKEGQVIKIPAQATSTSTNTTSKTFTINQSSETQVQSQVDSGQMAWYLDPIQVSKEEVPPTYSISKDDIYSLKTKNTATGNAIVEVVHNSKIFQINLTQPVKKGDTGIWAVSSVAAE
jgi:LysM repeat protein